ncbi:MAG: nucleotidyltransferase family protein [Planctomycetes bacterium]|nr:nucleotidyltransferase family protein [Planctomycetota bacterium]
MRHLPPLPHLRAAFGPSASWPDAGAARRHGLAPLWGAWHTAGDPDPRLTVCRDDHRDTVAREILLRSALWEILGAYVPVTTPPLVLKGMARVLADLPRPGLRPMLDLDLLVRACDLRALGGALSRCGFRPVPHGQIHWRRDGASPLDVDLHVAEDLPVRLDLSRPRALATLHGATAHGLDPVEDFLWTAVHAFLLHAWPRGIWLLDLRLLLDRIAREGRQDAVAERMRGAGLGRLLGEADAFLGGRRPRSRAPWAWRRLRDSWDGRGGAGEGEFLLLLASRDPVLSRLRRAWRIAFPSPPFLRRRYPSLPLGAARAMRVAQLAVRTGRALARPRTRG